MGAISHSIIAGVFTVLLPTLKKDSVIRSKNYLKPKVFHHDETRKVVWITEDEEMLEKRKTSGLSS